MQDKACILIQLSASKLMSRKSRVHYHSDCQFFAGCENMLANFINSDWFSRAHDLSFSYRQSASYEQGYKQRVYREIQVYPLDLPDLSEFKLLPNVLPAATKRVLSTFLRLLLTGPVVAYEVVVLFMLFRRAKPDILHINNGGYPGALSARSAAIAGKLARIPKVLMVVNNMAVGYQRFSRWTEYPLDRLVGRSVDMFVTGSEKAAERLRSALCFPEQKVTSIHNGISMRATTESVEKTRERLGIRDFEGVVFGVVALLIPRKGHQILLDAILKLVSENRLKNQSCVILIEGDGPLMHDLANFVILHGLQPWVIFVGNEKNVVDFMSALDVLVLPSVQDEDFPNVILEAMALGTPVIATRLAGIPEQVVDGVTGLLVEPRNVEQLSEAICSHIGSQDIRSKMGKAAQDRFNSHFTCPISLCNYSHLYQKLLGH